MTRTSVAASAMLAITAIAPPLFAQTAATARLVVTATNLRNDGGRVRCVAFASREGFPSDPRRSAGRAEGRPSDHRAQCTFESLVPGEYAIALHHDEDDDGVFDTGIFGIPMEGVGASRDAHGSMGPPSFDDARIDIPAGETHITIRMTYPM